MAEWLKARASKACIPLRVSGVRIPLSPPDFKPWLTPSFKQGSAFHQLTLLPSDQGLAICISGVES